jgi:hypothetical protein
MNYMALTIEVLSIHQYKLQIHLFWQKLAFLTTF